MDDLTHGVCRRHVLIPSNQAYHLLQRAIALRQFERQPDSTWPRAVLARRGTTHGIAELRPVTPQEQLGLLPEDLALHSARMEEQGRSLSDADVDTIDAVLALWGQRATCPADVVAISLDEILELRGLRKRLGGAGRRGGFERRQRRDLAESLERIQSVWLKVADVQVSNRLGRPKRMVLESRVFTLTDRIGQLAINGRMDQLHSFAGGPGRAVAAYLLGPGRQMALLSAKALGYHSRQAVLEKRLARYLAWQWRIEARRGVPDGRWRVSTLLAEVGVCDPGRNPLRIRERFEAALDRLFSDEILGRWEYEPLWSDHSLPVRQWWRRWTDAVVVISPPATLRAAYSSIDGFEQILSRQRDRSVAVRDLARRLRSVRLRLGVSQAVLAARLGVTRSYLSRLERGRQPPSTRIRERLLALVKQLEDQAKKTSAELGTTPDKSKDSAISKGLGNGQPEARHRNNRSAAAETPRSTSPQNSDY